MNNDDIKKQGLYGPMTPSIAPDAVRNKAERNRRIVGDYKNGMPSTQLEIKYGISRERVCQILRPLGAIDDKRAEKLAADLLAFEIRQEKKRQRKLKAEEAIRLVQQEGYSYHAAAHHVGLSRPQLENDVRNLGLVKTGLSQHGRWSRNWEERKRIILDGMEKRLSWDEIAHLCGLSAAGSLVMWMKSHMPEYLGKKKRGIQVDVEKRKETIIRMRAENKSWADIAATLGLQSGTTLVTWSKQNMSDFDSRRYYQPRARLHRSVPDDVIEERKSFITKRRDEGATWLAIATELNYAGQDTVRRWVKRHAPELFSEEAIRRNYDAYLATYEGKKPTEQVDTTPEEFARIMAETEADAPKEIQHWRERHASDETPPAEPTEEKKDD